MNTQIWSGQPSETYLPPKGSLTVGMVRTAIAFAMAVPVDAVQQLELSSGVASFNVNGALWGCVITKAGRLKKNSIRRM